MFFSCYFFISLTISVIWRSCFSVMPWRRQMAECERSIGSTPSPKAARMDTVASSRSCHVSRSALEDVAEQVLFQVLLDDGGKGGVSGLGSILRRTAQLFEQFRTAGVLVAAVTDGRYVTSYGVDDALRLAFVQHLHEGLQTTQAAGKTTISIGMYQYFFNLVYRHVAVQTAGKGSLQVLQIASGGIGSNGYDALLAEAQRVCLLCPQGSTESDQ